MANRPSQLCELKKDKFIGGQAGFVDTYNWAVRSIDNLAGGMNCKVDWTLPDHPVINVDIPENLGDGGAGGGNHFHFALTINGSTATIGEGCVQVGGYSYFTDGGTVSGVGSGTSYICVQFAFSNANISFINCASTTEIRSRQGDLTTYVFPLYKIVDGNLAVDYRPLPNAGCWEVAESISNNAGGSS